MGRRVAPDNTNQDTVCQAHFDEIATSWEQKYRRAGSMRNRTELFCREVAAQSGDAKVLDFGCGSGDISYHLGRAGFEVTGVDRSVEMIVRARQRFGGDGIRFELVGRGESATLHLPFEDGSFDVVVASSVFEYLSDPENVLRELARVTRCGGRLVSTVPNILHPVRWLECVERMFGVCVGRRVPAWYRIRGDYLTASRNRFLVRTWSRVSVKAGWCGLRVRRRAGSLLMLVGHRQKSSRSG